MSFNPGLKIGQILKNADEVWKYGRNATFKNNEYASHSF